LTLASDRNFHLNYKLEQSVNYNNNYVMKQPITTLQSQWKKRSERRKHCARGARWL